MDDMAARFALLSEERKIEVLAVFQQLVERGQRTKQESDRLGQEVRSLRNEFADLEGIPEETLRTLEGRSDAIKQEGYAVWSEFTALGFGGIFSKPCEPLNPTLWSKLPSELQQNVFAQLSYRHIVRLQTVDLAWHRYLSGDFGPSPDGFVSGDLGPIPDFMRKWDEINPKTFGMVSEGNDNDDSGIVAVRFYDSDSDKWFRFTHRSIFNEELIEMMHAADGGLVCVVPMGYDKQKDYMAIVVLNPLTRQWKELPQLPDALLFEQPRMVQLVMDRRTKSYKVLVVGPDELGGDGVSIYSSVTGEWSSPEASRDIIFGYIHLIDYNDYDNGINSLARQRPCAYDCVNGIVFDLYNDDEPEGDDHTDQSPWKTYSWKEYVLVHERLYLLHKEVYKHDHAGVVEQRQRLCISEFQAQAEWRPLLRNRAALKCHVNWVKVKDHACDGFEDRVDDSEMHLYACNGVLLVTSESSNQAWLCRDLLSSKWEAISRIPRPTYSLIEGEMSMFELRFDAIP